LLPAGGGAGAPSSMVKRNVSAEGYFDRLKWQRMQAAHGDV